MITDVEQLLILNTNIQKLYIWIYCCNVFHVSYEKVFCATFMAYEKGGYRFQIQITFFLNFVLSSGHWWSLEKGGYQFEEVG